MEKDNDNDDGDDKIQTSQQMQAKASFERCNNWCHLPIVSSKVAPPFLPKNGRNAEPDFCCHNFGLKRYILSKWVFSSLPLLALVREIEGVLSEIMCGLFPARSEFKWLRWGVPNRRFKVGRSRWTTAKQIWNVSMHVLHKFFHNLTNATAYHLGWYSCSSSSTKQLHDWGNIFHSIAIIFWAENKIRNDKEAISRWRHFPRIDLESE